MENGNFAKMCPKIQVNIVGRRRRNRIHNCEIPLKQLTEMGMYWLVAVVQNVAHNHKNSNLFQTVRRVDVL